MRVSVVIPSYNSQETIQQCLSSLLNQECDPRLFEIIVVDSSFDRTAHIIKDRFPTVRLIKLDQRTYQGPTLNRGIQQSKGEIIAYMDADCIAAPDWIQQIIGAHESETDVNIISGTLLNGHVDSLVSWAEYFTTGSEYFEGSKRRFVKHIHGGNGSCKRGVFETMRFPEIPRGEDLVFSANLQKDNEKILFEPKIRVFHLYRTELKAVLVREFRYGKILHKLAKESSFKGAFVIRNRLLALNYPIIKLLLILTRTIRWNRKQFFILLKALPFSGLMLFAATMGMVVANPFKETINLKPLEYPVTNERTVTRKGEVQ